MDKPNPLIDQTKLMSVKRLDDLRSQLESEAFAESAYHSTIIKLLDHIQESNNEWGLKLYDAKATLNVVQGEKVMLEHRLAALKLSQESYEKNMLAFMERHWRETIAKEILEKLALEENAPKG